jgi:hypothetical protein
VVVPPGAEGLLRVDMREDAAAGGIARVGLGPAGAPARMVGGIARFDLGAGRV